MKQTKRKSITSWQIAATYIGTVVGAGFASGQEVLQFFGYFGYKGILGLILAGVLFIYFGLIILDLGRELKASSHLPIINYAGGKWVGNFIDYVITFFLFGALTAMAAGAGAIFKEQFNLSPFLGNGFILVLTLVTVLTGISGVVSAISIVVPLLLISVTGIAFYIIFTKGIIIPSLEVLAGTPAVPGWPLAAIVYVSYNLVMAVAILGPLGHEAKNKERLKKGAIWGGVGLGIGALAILLPLYATLPQAAKFEIPMIYVSGQISPLVQRLYSFILVSEIYTTAVGSLFGFTVRLVSPQKPRMNTIIAIGTTIAAFLASQFGFTNIVRTLYPLVGYAGLTMLGGFLYRKWSEHTLLPQPLFKKKE